MAPQGMTCPKCGERFDSARDMNSHKEDGYCMSVIEMVKAGFVKGLNGLWVLKEGD